MNIKKLSISLTPLAFILISFGFQATPALAMNASIVPVARGVPGREGPVSVAVLADYFQSLDNKDFSGFSVRNRGMPAMEFVLLDEMSEYLTKAKIDEKSFLALAETPEKQHGAVAAAISSMIQDWRQHPDTLMPEDKASDIAKMRSWANLGLIALQVNHTEAVQRALMQGAKNVVAELGITPEQDGVRIAASAAGQPKIFRALEKSQGPAPKESARKDSVKMIAGIPAGNHMGYRNFRGSLAALVSATTSAIGLTLLVYKVIPIGMSGTSRVLIMTTANGTAKWWEVLWLLGYPVVVLVGITLRTPILALYSGLQQGYQAFSTGKKKGVKAAFQETLDFLRSTDRQFEEIRQYSQRWIAEHHEPAWNALASSFHLGVSAGVTLLASVLVGPHLAPIFWAVAAAQGLAAIFSARADRKS